MTHVDVQLHGVFYMVCQSMMYLFCFRHKQLLEKYGHAWVRRLRFSKIVSSNLNPLKVSAWHWLRSWLGAKLRTEETHSAFDS